MERNFKNSAGRRAKAILFPWMWLLCAAAMSQVFAMDVNLAWNASPDAGVTGYKLYYGLVGATKQTMNVGLKTNCTVTGLLSGKAYEFQATAYNATSESDPSNLLSYSLPADTGTGGGGTTSGTGYYTLTINAFKNGYVQVSPRGSGLLGDQYLAGTQVTLTGVAKSGATFSGWNINGTDYPSNPQMITINGDTAVTPFFKVAAGTPVGDTTNPGPSMSMQMVNGQTTISIGGEIGAWALERSTDLRNWQLTATGMTSEQIAVNLVGHNAFYRVRAFNAATDL
jgi:hypothetical protein